jgi:uncharacterized protein YfaS (alpha-2-macroglobulin family)
MFVESYLVDPKTKKPYIQKNLGFDHTHLKIYDGKDAIVHTGTATTFENGTAVMTYLVPEDMKGGDYRAEVDVDNNSVPVASRKFYINEFRELELKVTVDFNQDKYTFGEKVEAKIKVKKPDGTALPVCSTVDI